MAGETSGARHLSFAPEGAAMHVPLWGWLVFLIFVAGCFALDLAFGHRRDIPVSVREAAIWSGVWAAVGLLFTVVITAVGGGEAGGQYLAGFLIEKSLSVDNVFVFAMVFAYFAVPPGAQHRALLYGVVGALVLRGVFIAAGASLLAAVHASVWLLGALLIGTGIRMALHDEGEVHPDRNVVLRLMRRLVPMGSEYVGDRLWSRRAATPLLGVLAVVATTDVLFAVDSVPAVFAVTRNTFVVFAANAFSVLGLRPLYFLLAEALERFEKLRYGLAAVLLFVGSKMLLADVVELSVWVSLLVILTLLAVSILSSLRAHARAIEQADSRPAMRPLEFRSPRGTPPCR
jgi:tellurite resistance protein TerC